MDDIIITVSNFMEIKQFLRQLTDRFFIKDLETLSYFQGAETMFTSAEFFFYLKKVQLRYIIKDEYVKYQKKLSSHSSQLSYSNHTMLALLQILYSTDEYLILAIERYEKEE